MTIGAINGYGDADVIVPYNVVINTQQRIPNAQLHTIAIGSHLMINTDGYHIGQIITQFMTSVQTTAP